MKLNLLLFIAAAATLGLGMALARQPEAAPAPHNAPTAPPSIHDAAEALVARAQRCEELGLIDAAISSCAAALALENANLPAQAALLRLSTSPTLEALQSRQPSDASNARPGLEEDRTRGGLDRTIIDLQRQVTQNENDIRRLQSALDRARSDIDRFRNSPR